jgi:hypothetical protein
MTSIPIQNTVNLYDFDEFPPVYNKIYLPKNTLLYRGYDSHFPIISERPSYYTSKINVASSYLRNSFHKLSAFKTTKTLKLYDLRYIKHILTDLLTQLESNDESIIKFCEILTISYGLSSCNYQLELLKKVFGSTYDTKVYDSITKFLIDCKINKKHNRTVFGINPLEPQGIRIGETTTDSISALFLKDLFSDQIAGYIAPKMKSPFHYTQGGINTAEILIFNPKMSGLELIKDADNYTIIKHNFIENYLSQDKVKHKKILFNKKITPNKNSGSNSNKIQSGLSRSSIIMYGGTSKNLMYGGHINKKYEPNKIFDSNNGLYEEINNFVKNTIKKIYGSNYYDELINKNKILPDEDLQKNIHCMSGIHIELKQNMKHPFADFAKKLYPEYDY